LTDANSPGTVPHGAARRPRRAPPTGRHIVLLRDGLGRRGAQTLYQLAGLRVGVSSDNEGRRRAAQHVAPGEGMLFHRTGAALVHADPDQLAALGTQAGQELVHIEPERVVHAIHVEGGCTPSGTPAAARIAPLNESLDTWGRQTAGVTVSRFTGRGIRVAILDTGLDLRHPDFLARSIVSESFVPGVGVDDGNGHGTYCAGVACGPAAPAQSPRYGVAADADLYIGKVIADNGSGTDGSILAGIDWAVRNGCAVVSLSVGSPVAPQEPYSAIYEQVAQRALAAGTLIMAAAGNDSLRPDEIAPVDHPANCPSILAIAALDVYLRIAPFSCGGINAGGGEVDLAAPGVGIRSAWPHPDLYRTDSGTSMAVPFAAGIAALLAEANPTIRGRDLHALLTRSAQALPLPTRDVGAGLTLAP
jgi:subtilisin family serine protease